MITQRINQLIQSDKAFVLYKKPLDNQVTVIVQNNTNLYNTTHFEESGFVFAPFDDTKPTVIFPENHTTVTNLELASLDFSINNNTSTESSNSKDRHIELVKKTIQFIASGKAHKVVVSRKEKHSFPIENVGFLFEKMLVNPAYSETMIYLWRHPKVGTWLGASPERLIELNGNSYNTMALAGTQTYKEACTWGHKEKQEQKWVTESIRYELSGLSKSMSISDPFTKKAGHLAHICCIIKGELKEDTRLYSLLNHLHPTPAVCGTPTDISKNFILANEGYDREFYTGFLGTINLNDKTELFVNLRCMQLEKKHALLYVGGGITKDSKPEEEWVETVNKAKTMLYLLNQS